MIIYRLLQFYENYYNFMKIFWLVLVFNSVVDSASIHCLLIRLMVCRWATTIRAPNCPFFQREMSSQGRPRRIPRQSTSIFEPHGNPQRRETLSLINLSGQSYYSRTPQGNLGHHKTPYYTEYHTQILCLLSFIIF